MLAACDAEAHLGPGVEPGFTVVHELLAGELRSTYLMPREVAVRVFNQAEPSQLTSTTVLERIRQACQVSSGGQVLEPRLVSAWYSEPRGSGLADAGTSTSGANEGLARKEAPWSLVQVQLSRRLPNAFETLRFRFELPEAFVEHVDDPSLLRTLNELVFPLLEGDERHPMRFTREQTEYVFQRQRQQVAQTSADASTERGFGSELAPWALALLFLLLLGAVHIGPPSRRPLLATAALLVLALLSLALVRGPMARDEALPRGAERAAFETLLRGVYGAFGRATESEIYDALAMVVEGPLLESLYRDVYRSLVRKEHEGARASVQRIALLSVEIESSAIWVSTVTVRAEWRVESRVEHFAHVHDRTLRYRGRFEVARSPDGQPRIVSAALEDQDLSPNAP